MKWIIWAISLPLIIVAVVFAVANRHLVTLDIWPFELPVSLPLYQLLLGTLFVGLLIGWFFTFLSAGRSRATAREALYRAEVLERENSRQRPAAAAKTKAPGLPAVQRG